MKVKLKDICEIQSGGTPNRSNKQYWDNGTINWAKISDIKDKYLFNTEEKITEEGLKNSSAKLFKKNSILYTIFATLGEACILGIDTTTNQAIANLEIRNKNVEPEYIYYYLLSKKKLISSIGRGVAQNNINLSILKEMEINITDIVIQIIVINILNLIESIISKYKKQIELLDTLIKARFVEMFGDIKYNDKGFEIKKLHQICNGIGDGLHGTPEYVTSSKYAFINGNNLVDGKIEINGATKYISEETYIKNQISMDKNTILISINGTLGNIAFYNNELIMLGKSVCYCNFKKDVNKHYIYYLMKSSRFIEYMETNSTKSTIKNVGLKAMREYNIIVPPVELQNQFATFVKHINKLKFDMQKSLEKTQMLFDSLMQEYFG